MRIQVFFISAFLICIHNGYSQTAGSEHDFDADSVLYTPIPKNIVPAIGTEKSPIDSIRSTRQYFLFKSGFITGSIPTYTTSAIFGFRLTSLLRAGLGTGFDSYSNLKAIPAFINLNIESNKRRLAPFISINVGVAKVWGFNNQYWGWGNLDRSTGRMMINPEVGLRLKYQKMRLGLSVGWKSQKFVSYYSQNNIYWDPVELRMVNQPNLTTVKGTVNRFAVNLLVGWN